MNKLFPGRPNYAGPTTGWFGLLHHAVPLEHSHNVIERVGYVQNNKPEGEIAIRLWNMIYLDPAAVPAVAKCAPLNDDYEAKCAPLNDDYEAKCAPLDAEILAYIKKHIPDCAWNGTELVFP
jgi:hypothetical protein